MATMAELQEDKMQDHEKAPRTFEGAIRLLHDLLNGEINVDTAPGEGTRMAVRLLVAGKERSGWKPEEDRS